MTNYGLAGNVSSGFLRAGSRHLILVAYLMFI